MKCIHAVSLVPQVNDWLANSGHPRILHIFDHACNLINERMEVLSIVTPQIGKGPFNLVIADEICFSQQLGLEAEISASPTRLHLGDLTVHTDNASIWNARPDWEVLHSQKVNITNQLTQLLLTNYLNIGGFDRQALPISQSLVSNLSLALVNADISSARKLVSQLAGLGVGLTPSGDDIIMGAMYATWILHPPTAASVIAQQIADTAAPLTTSLSGAWLRSAGRGEVGILWHRFFDALVSVGRIGNPTYLQETMKNILAVGETSGADALAGFIGVFVSWLEKAGA